MNVWLPIGDGVDPELTELELLLATIDEGHQQAERDLGAARAEILRLDGEVAMAERDEALGRKPKSRVKLLADLETARAQVAPLIQTVEGRRLAVKAMRDQLELFVTGNAERLLEQHQPAATAAQEQVLDAIETLRQAVSAWIATAHQAARVVTKQQGRSAHEVPELPAALTALLSDPLDVPLPLPRPRPIFALDEVA